MEGDRKKKETKKKYHKEVHRSHTAAWARPGAVTTKQEQERVGDDSFHTTTSSCRCSTLQQPCCPLRDRWRNLLSRLHLASLLLFKFMGPLQDVTHPLNTKVHVP